jgi:hypothetical protein
MTDLRHDCRGGGGSGDEQRRSVDAFSFIICAIVIPAIIEKLDAPFFGVHTAAALLWAPAPLNEEMMLQAKSGSITSVQVRVEGLVNCRAEPAGIGYAMQMGLIAGPNGPAATRTAPMLLLSRSRGIPHIEVSAEGP